MRRLWRRTNPLEPERQGSREIGNFCTGALRFEASRLEAARSTCRTATVSVLYYDITERTYAVMVRITRCWGVSDMPRNARPCGQPSRGLGRRDRVRNSLRGPLWTNGCMYLNLRCAPSLFQPIKINIGHDSVEEVRPRTVCRSTPRGSLTFSGVRSASA